MKKIRFSYFLIFLLPCLSLQAQLYPGDANNNGRVDNIDILFIGFAYGTPGPSRITIETDFDEQNIPLLWEEWFPDGTNYAFADSDGDGLISFLDFSVVFINYALETTVIEPTTFVSGDPQVDPQLNLGSQNTNFITSGSVVEIPIVLGSEDIPVENLNGIAFSVLYNEAIVSEISVDLFTDSWLASDQGLMVFQKENDSTPGKIDIGLSRFGQDPVTGHGPVGTVSIVIQEDLVGFIPTPADSMTVCVGLTDIVGVNDGFDEVVIAGDSSKMMIYHPDFLTNTKIPTLEEAVEIFPNPSPAVIKINCRYGIERVQVFDLMGRVVQEHQPENATSMELDLEAAEPCVRIVKVVTPAGMISQKILMEPKS